MADKLRALISIHTPNTKWYWRLWFVLKIPYEVIMYVFTGNMKFGEESDEEVENDQREAIS